MIENIISNIQSIGVFLIFLSVLIVVHEWGHFITAKKLGIDVEEFALGFGPTLFAKTHNGTNYMLKAFPLGGYVKMAGDERDKCTGSAGEFYSQPVGHRALVVVNGPMVNFVLAYACFVLVFMLGYPGLSTRVAEVYKDGPAYQAGLQIGDRVLAIDGRKVYSWTNLEERLAGSSVAPINVTVKRNTEILTKTMTPVIEQRPNMVGRPRNVRTIGIGGLANKVGGLAAGYPAAEAGIKVGDQIIEINGIAIHDWTTLEQTISRSTGKVIKLKVLRDGEQLSLQVVPKIEKAKSPTGEEIETRKIGIGPLRELELTTFGPVASLRLAWEELYYITILTYESLWRMVNGAISAKESVTGPVGIFYIVTGAAQEGVSHLLFIMGIISASLAIFNLLPIIPLDGGHLFLQAIEKIRGRVLPPKVEEYIVRIGVSLIICLALFVFYSDFARFGWIDAVKKLFS